MQHITDMYVDGSSSSNDASSEYGSDVSDHEQFVLPPELVEFNQRFKMPARSTLARERKKIGVKVGKKRKTSHGKYDLVQSELMLWLC